jgi:type IV secretion system protein VirB2
MIESGSVPADRCDNSMHDRRLCNAHPALPSMRGVHREDSLTGRDGSGPAAGLAFPRHWRTIALANRGKRAGISVSSALTRAGRLAAPLASLFWSSAASAQATLADPQGSGIIVRAVQWLQGTLLGTIATTVAVIAVAVCGFMMLTGRMNWRYGATVILGCFILFGAVSIVAGIQSTAGLGR